MKKLGTLLYIGLGCLVLANLLALVIFFGKNTEPRLVWVSASIGLLGVILVSIFGVRKVFTSGLRATNKNNAAANQLNEKIRSALDEYNRSLRLAKSATNPTDRLEQIHAAQRALGMAVPLVEWAWQSAAIQQEHYDLAELKRQQQELDQMIQTLQPASPTTPTNPSFDRPAESEETPLPFTLIEPHMMNPLLTWNDIVLDPNCLRELQQVQRVLKHPQLASELGIAPPTGLLLYGTPGTGKTSLARVLACQSECAFLSVTPADIRSRWWGQSENNIKLLFDTALKKAPTILFFDELDALFPIRGGESSLGDATINQMLAALDGVLKCPGVYVVGATNRVDIVDPALLRGGRLSRKIFVPLPELEQRHQLLKLFTKSVRLADSVNLHTIAKRTESLSGADLHALVQQSGINALERFERVPHSPRAIMMKDFKEAFKELQLRF